MSIVLPLVILVPFVFAGLSLLINRRNLGTLSIISSILTFILVIAIIYQAFTYGIGSVSFNSEYIPSLGIGLHLQVTDLTLILVLMTSIVFLSASVVGTYFIEKGERIYGFIFLVAEGASIGLFLSANLFLFYVFFEIAEIMMFFIIFVYGGYDRRYASIKFIVYSLVASLLLLVGIMVIYANVTPHTFDINQIAAEAGSMPVGAESLAMLLLLIAFMIKIPVFPFHSWLPDAHTEAPTTGSMILAGVLLKFGGYGLLLIFLMLPLASHYGLYLAALFGFSAIYAAFVAMRQGNIKRMIAYTSITDMGIVALGVTAGNVLGTSGAIYAMLSHGLAVSLLFLVAGTLDELYGTLEISKIKGVMRLFPSLSYLFIIGVFAVVGLPLTSGFVGDLLIFFGAFNRFGIEGIIPIVSLVLMGGFLFWMIEKMFWGPKHSEAYKALEKKVIYGGLLLLAATFILGILPSIMLAISGL